MVICEKQTPIIKGSLKNLIIFFTFFSLTKKSNKKSQAKTPNPFFLTQKAFAMPLEKLGFHTVLAKPTAPIPTYAVILVQGKERTY